MTSNFNLAAINVVNRPDGPTDKTREGETPLNVQISFDNRKQMGDQTRPFISNKCVTPLVLIQRN